MGAIPEVDPDEPIETKPFKFVTGKCTLPPPAKTGANRLLLRVQWLIPMQLVRISSIFLRCDRFFFSEYLRTM